MWAEAILLVGFTLWLVAAVRRFVLRALAGCAGLAIVLLRVIRWVFRGVIQMFVILQLAAAPAPVPGQIDSICRAQCEILAVRSGNVTLVDRMLDRNIALGKYAAQAQHLVPRTEAPVVDARSHRGWRVVVSVYLDHDQDEVMTHVRFFAPDGKLRMSTEALMTIEQSEIGNLFGLSDEIFALTSNEEHSYNAQSEIWFLPVSGEPRLLLEIGGDYGKFSAETGGGAAGLTVARQTYDGVNAGTKGTADEFYVWDRGLKSLTLRK